MMSRTRRIRLIAAVGLVGLAGLTLILSGCDTGTKTSDNDIDYVGTGKATELMQGGRKVLGLGGDNQGAWVDPRSKSDYEEGHIPGAISMPFARVAQEYTALTDYDFVIVYGDSYNDPFAKAMSKRLIELGIDSVHVLKGGIQAWVSAGNNVDTGQVEPQVRAKEE